MTHLVTNRDYAALSKRRGIGRRTWTGRPGRATGSCILTNAPAGMPGETATCQPTGSITR
jgi:hypothetical protein